jgi:RNA polymerase sigma-70 factor (ECF subfamily)
MEVVDGVEGLFEREFVRLSRALGVAFGAHDAADAVQDAFIAADRRWRDVSRMQDPAGWVRRVAVNRLLNRRRNERRRAEILATIDTEVDAELDVELIDLRRAVGGLPPQMRVTVCLHYIADLTVDDVAAALGVAPGTVKSNLHDARRRLRTQLEEPS